MAKDQGEAFEALLKAFKRENINFMVVGAYAVSHYGYPRTTKDIDVFVYPSRENYQKLSKVLDEMGYDVSPLQERSLDHITPIKLTDLGKEYMDIITNLNNNDPDQLFQNAEPYQYGQTEVKIISYDDLIRVKSQTNRMQDWLDVSKLQKQRELKTSKKQRSLVRRIKQAFKGKNKGKDE